MGLSESTFTESATARLSIVMGYLWDWVPGKIGLETYTGIGDNYR